MELLLEITGILVGVIGALVAIRGETWKADKKWGITRIGVIAFTCALSGGVITVVSNKLKRDNEERAKTKAIEQNELANLEMKKQFDSLATNADKNRKEITDSIDVNIETIIASVDLHGGTTKGDLEKLKHNLEKLRIFNDTANKSIQNNILASMNRVYSATNTYTKQEFQALWDSVSNISTRSSTHFSRIMAEAKKEIIATLSKDTFQFRVLKEYINRQDTSRLSELNKKFEPLLTKAALRQEMEAILESKLKALRDSLRYRN